MSKHDKQYAGFKNGRKTKFVASTYEGVRNEIRKVLRKTQAGNFFTVNPQIGDFGYSIRQIAV